MNKLLSIAFVALLAACSVPVKDTIPPDAIYCRSKQDSSLDFIYEPKNATQWHSEEYKVDIYLIDTVDGKQIALNSLELENYICDRYDTIVP
jgi:hypothetical protein